MNKGFDLQAFVATHADVAAAEQRLTDLRSRLAQIEAQRQELAERVAVLNAERDRRLQLGEEISRDLKTERIARLVDAEDLAATAANTRRLLAQVEAERGAAVRTARERARAELEDRLAEMGARARVALLEGFRILRQQRPLAAMLLETIRDPSGSSRQQPGSDTPARWLATEIAATARIAGLIIDPRHMDLPGNFDGTPLGISAARQKVEVDG